MSSFSPVLNNKTENFAAKAATDSPKLQLEGETSSHFYVFLFVTIGVIIVIIVVLIIKWIIREKRLRELRHRLIPLYTFDPNEEDDWEAELLSQDQSIFSQKPPQDYNSVNFNEDDSLINKRKLNVV